MSRGGGGLFDLNLPPVFRTVDATPYAAHIPGNELSLPTGRRDRFGIRIDDGCAVLLPTEVNGPSLVHVLEEWVT